MANLPTAIVLAVAIAAVACTVSLAKISAPLRVWVARRDGRAWAWIGQLIGCPYCVTHWLAFAASAIYRPVLVDLWLPLDLLVTAFAIVGLAMVPVLVIRRGIAPLKIQLDQPASGRGRQVPDRDEIRQLLAETQRITSNGAQR